MSFIATAVVAVGAGVSAYGAAKNASAQRKAANAAANNLEGLYIRGSEGLNDLIKSKNKKLHNLGNIFDRFKSSGAFGNTDTVDKLRQAQEDFASLAAGDFSGFEAQVKKSMSDALVSTVGSGSPVGSYAQLAADTQMQYRLQGIQTASGISEFLGNQANNLLNLEFGVMDQRFQTAYQMDKDRVLGVNSYKQQAAATEGVGWTAAGNALQQVGSFALTGVMNQQNIDYQNKSLDFAREQAAMQQSRPTYTPSYAPYSPSTSVSYSAQSFNDSSLSPIGLYEDPVDQFSQPSPFSYGSGYKYTPSMVPVNNGSGNGMVLPDKLTYSSSILSGIGSRIASA